MAQTQAEREARAELAELSVDELNARNEELEQQKGAIRQKQLILVEVRARRMRADRLAAADAQHARPGIAEVTGKAVR